MANDSSAKAVFSDKPFPVPIEMRPLWRICLIIVAVAIVSGSKRYLDISKVNILVWMLIRKSKWEEYEDFLTSRSVDLPLISVDTATYKAVEFALAKDFAILDSGRICLTNKSDVLISLLKNNQIMDDEFDFLSRNGKYLTEKKVKALTGGLL
jgi:hypothetical protein